MINKTNNEYEVCVVSRVPCVCLLSQHSDSRISEVCTDVHRARMQAVDAWPARACFGHTADGVGQLVLLSQLFVCDCVSSM